MLSHWGLELQLPDQAGSGEVELEFADATIATIGIGTFKLMSKQKDGRADCALSVANVMARCTIGQGAAIILADADFLNDDFWSGQGEGDARRLTDMFIADLKK